jgi:tetratricopeptide (TPR) repeat protein
VTYPGNSDLTTEIRRRVRETFLQTLDLAAGGSQREALLGCDFILRLDPLFEPARTLQQQLKAGGELALETLRATLGDTDEDAAAANPASVEIAPALEDLGSIELDLSLPAPPEVSQPPEANQPLPAATAQLDTAPGLGVDRTTQPIEVDVAQIDDRPTMHLDSAPPLEAIEGAAEATPPPGSPVGSSAESESDQRIRELLDEGQAAFDLGEHQLAIDAWSRIFLIDIDHEEAGRRIDQARKLKAEIERSLEQTLHEGIELAESGDYAKAREAFERVLEEEPGHNEAREHLQLLEIREKGEAAPSDAPDPGGEPRMSPPSAEARAADPAAEETPGRAADSGPASASDQAAGSADAVGDAPRMAPMQAAKETRQKPSRLFLIIGSAVLALALGGGWFLFTNWSRLFPNAAAEGAEDPIARAQELQQSGQTATAIAELQKIPADDPAHARAQALIARMKQAPKEKAAEFELDDALAERAEILSRARSALAAGDAIDAESLYQQANELAPLAGEAAATFEDLRRRLDPVRGQLEVFRQGEWEIALRELWRLHQDRPDNQVISDLMVDCYYNLGVRDLQRGDSGSAAEMFGEAGKLRPGDRQLERLARFATTYRTRSPDLQYRIFVKYLPFH